MTDPPTNNKMPPQRTGFGDVLSSWLLNGNEWIVCHYTMAKIHFLHSAEIKDGCKGLHWAGDECPILPIVTTPPMQDPVCKWNLSKIAAGVVFFRGGNNIAPLFWFYEDLWGIYLFVMEICLADKIAGFSVKLCPYQWLCSCCYGVILPLISHWGLMLSYRVLVIALYPGITLMRALLNMSASWWPIYLFNLAAWCCSCSLGGLWSDH